MFQWGHDITVVETFFFGCFSRYGLKFQWGHDITVVETSSDLIKWRGMYNVSMGPRHYSRGNKEFVDDFGAYKHSFNGATTLQSWKPKRGKIMKLYHCPVSMGPRHYSRGNYFFEHEFNDDNLCVSMGPRHYSRGNTS